MIVYSSLCSERLCEHPHWRSHEQHNRWHLKLELQWTLSQPFWQFVLHFLWGCIPLQFCFRREMDNDSNKQELKLSATKAACVRALCLQSNGQCSWIQPSLKGRYIQALHTVWRFHLCVVWTCAKALGTGTCFFFKAHNYEWSLAAQRPAISFSWRLAQCCRLEGGMARWSDPIEVHVASWLQTLSSEAYASHCQTLGGWRLPSRCTQWNNRFWILLIIF